MYLQDFLQYGDTIESAHQRLTKENKFYTIEFNGVRVNSRQSIDDWYKKITGVSKIEYELKLKKAALTQN